MKPQWAIANIMKRIWRLTVPTKFDPYYEMMVEMEYYPAQMAWADKICPNYANDG